MVERSGTATIRRATDGDASAVAALWTEAYFTNGVGGRDEPYTADDFHDSNRRGEIFVAVGAGEIAGAVVLLSPGVAGRLAAKPDEGELSRLAVALRARQEGIGCALTALCERHAQGAGWPAIALWSRPTQIQAHRLYESLGYRRAPERDSIDAKGRGRLVFRLALTLR